MWVIDADSRVAEGGAVEEGGLVQGKAAPVESPNDDVVVVESCCCREHVQTGLTCT
jgi:hypothetical protein